MQNEEMHPVLFYANCLKEAAGILLWGGFLNWLGISRIIDAFQQPDINRDGSFTISDLTVHLSDIFFATGDIFLSWMAEFEIGVFFEMSASEPNVVISFIINFLTWGVIWAGLYSVYKLARHRDGEVWL